MSRENRVDRLEQRMGPQYESVTLFCDKEHAPAPQDFVRAALSEAEGFPTVIVKSFQPGGEARFREIEERLERARQSIKEEAQQ